MEREVRDVLSALAGCVAMRCAAEKNLEDIANLERLQRAVWEAEFSASSADPAAAVLLPRAGVSRRRAREKNRTTAAAAAAKGSSDGGGDRGDGGNDNNAKGIGNNGTGTPTYSGERCYTTYPSGSEENHSHHQQQQQYRVSSLRHGSGEQKLVRVHSLGSAKFLFDSALDHRKSGLPARTRSNGSEISTEGLQYPSAASDVWGAQNENASSINNNNGGSGQGSTRSRWGKENVTLKTYFSPFKLAGGANELPGSVETAEFASTDTPRYSPTPASHRDTLDGGRRKVSPTIGRKPLCGSTWLGPEASPVPQDQDTRLTRGINFEASPWSDPRRAMKLRRGRKVIGCRGEGERRNSIGKERELDLEREMRWQRGRRGDKQRVASISEAGNTPPGQQAAGIQVQACQGGPKGLEGGESRRGSTSSNVGQKRNHTGDSSAVAGHDSEEHGGGGATWDFSARANGSSSPSSLLWQEEACPGQVCSPSSCPPLIQGDRAHPGERRGDELMEKIISETSPKAPSYQAEEGGAESRRPDVRVEPMREIDCSKKNHQLPAEAPETDGRTGNNASSRREISHEKALPEFGAEWSPRAYYQNDDRGEDNTAGGVDDDEETEITTSDEDDDDPTRSDPLIFSKSASPRPRDDVAGGDGGRNEATDDTSTTSRSSAVEGTSRTPRPNSDNIGHNHLRDDSELEVLVRRTEIDGGAFASPGGVETSAASSTTTTPFRCCTPDVEKTIFVARERDRMSVGRQQQQPQNIQHSKRQQQQQQQQQQHPQHRLSAEPQKNPLGQPQHHHQHQRQRRRQSQQPHPLWQQPQRRGSAAGDPGDRSGCNLMQEKLTTLLTKRLKQLAQLEALTIQWERLPRREQEKLDRQQRLMSSRFRLTEQARWDSGVSLSTVPVSTGPAMTVNAVNHSPPAPAAGVSSVSHHRTTPSTGGGGGGNGRISGSYILPPSDASISASVDLPPSGARDGGLDTTTSRGFSNGASSSGEGLRGASFSVSGRVAARHPRRISNNTGGGTPRGQRRRREEFGRGERGCRGGGVACSVRDADTASGRARRWRLGNPSLRIVGVKTSMDDK